MLLQISKFLSGEPFLMPSSITHLHPRNMLYYNPQLLIPSALHIRIHRELFLTTLTITFSGFGTSSKVKPGYCWKNKDIHTKEGKYRFLGGGGRAEKIVERRKCEKLRN